MTQPPPAIAFEDWKEVERTPLVTEYSAKFESAMITRYPENNVVPLRILMPADAERPVPAVIVLHYWGARDLKVERALGAELNRHGIAAVLLTLPYHLSRTPAGAESGELALDPDPDSLISNMVQSVWDVRRAVDFLESRPEIDHAKIGVAGTSLGAVVATEVYAVEPRIGGAAFIFGGVDLANLIWESSRTVRQRDQLRKRGFTEDRLRAALAPVEPLQFLKARAPAPTFVVSANYDTVVPRESTAELIRALKDPKTLAVDTGHYGGIFVERRLLREVGNFFGTTFGGKEYVPPKRIYAPTVRIGGLANTATGFDLAVGLDLLKFDHRGDGFASLLLTPRGLELFAGRRIDSRITFGGLASRRRVGLGLFWSAVL